MTARHSPYLTKSFELYNKTRVKSPCPPLASIHSQYLLCTDHGCCKRTNWMRLRPDADHWVLSVMQRLNWFPTPKDETTCNSWVTTSDIVSMDLGSRFQHLTLLAIPSVHSHAPLSFAATPSERCKRRRANRRWNNTPCVDSVHVGQTGGK